MEELLEEFGLNKTESTVLISLLETGGSSASLIAKRTDLNRTTVYSALAELERLGTVQRLKRDSRTVFVPLEPEELVEVFKTQAESSYQDSLRSLEVLRPRIERLPRQTRHDVGDYEVTYTRTLNGCLQVLDKALRAEYCGIFNPHHALTGGFDTVGESALKANQKDRPKIRDVAINGPGVKQWYRYAQKNPNHQIRTIDGDRTLYTDILLSQGVVNLFNYNLEAPMVIQIRHPDYYKFMMMIFDQVWLSASPFAA